jgi:alpha-2-macroglobulin
VATGSGKPQLPRRLPPALLAALTLAAALGGATGARGQYEPSGYQPLGGAPFFLLSDKAYGTSEIAQVRLEVGTDFGLGPVEENGGVDVVVYRVPQPLSFLKQQRNLHRVRVEGLAREEGLANTLVHLWDRWYKASRLAWRRVFSSEARESVTKQAPELKTDPAIHAPSRFRHPPQWKPLKGFDLVSRFRYPVHRARSIAPPKGVELSGSSSEFIEPKAGNVMIPLGRQQPGLYLIEAYVGAHRGTTLVFVSDTVAITKVSSGELMVWTAERSGGTAVRGVELAWSDGAGVLQSGTTDAAGLFRFRHAAPERSYVFGADPAGGVFVSESFYYDSEIYDAKVYAVTDRPLYRPGDQVFVKFVGRHFQSARQSAPLPAGPLELVAYDPNGVPVATQKLQVSPEAGGDTTFRLPENATGGGYELRFTFRGNAYGAAFRVAEYQKPHFEITLVADKPDFKTKEPITGRLQLNYPDGGAVAGAEVQLSVRAQQLTMVDGELGYSGLFPVKLTVEKMATDARGEARFTLPPAEQPSRYVLTVLATDGAAYRVKTTRELLVERGRSAFTLETPKAFTSPGETVAFAIRPAGPPAGVPVTWEWVRLEDQRRQSGTLTAPDRLDMPFPESGSYTVQLRDAQGDVVAGLIHFVSGPGLRPPAGSIAMVPSKEKCAPGETVDVLITFPEPVEEALLTLERDRVEQAALMGNARGWVRATKLAPTQWRARVPVRAEYAPNITLSVVYVKNGDYVFQNQGLQVAQPRVEVALRTLKEAFAPGETVQVEVATTVKGKGAPATVVVSVVDEMIYALQPEIAPDIHDFFYHPRRNNVRTASSLSFIGYDLAATRAKGAPARSSVSERRVKVLERPRREDVDTAFWQPALRTDASGRARFSFVMPDSLTRWRVTGRAFTADGTVGQRTAHLRSFRELYVKWTSPAWMRQGDEPTASIALFNQTERVQAVDVEVAGPGLSRKESVTLKPGANFIAQPLGSLSGDGLVRVTVSRAGQVADALETPFSRLPTAWRSPRTLMVDVSGSSVPLRLPADARNVRVRLASSSAAHFGRVIDDLLEYPYGCVEQTASRMIPFALAIQSLGRDPHGVGDRLRQQLNGQRLRLAYMAGPKATFAWWGDATTSDPMLTAYAYYADHVAVRALGVELPREHWSRLLEVYAESGHQGPLVHRALMLAWMQEMRLPVKGLAEALLADLAKSHIEPAPARSSPTLSPILAEPEGRLARALAVALADAVAGREGLARTPERERALEDAYAVLGSSGRPEAEAWLIASDRLPAPEAERVLREITAEMPTMERALTLVWLERALAGSQDAFIAPALEAPWQRSTTARGAADWRWPAGRALPAEVRLAQAVSAPTTAIVQFDSAAPERAQLPLTVQRRFYRVSRSGEESYELQPLGDGEALLTGELYLDEVQLTPTGRPLRHALLEVPLPPGAAVESTTWGIRILNNKGEAEDLERARHEPTPRGYVAPIDPLDGPATLRHLVRFAQKGTYTLPPARVYRMYQPEAKAFEGGPRKLEVQ